MTFGQLLDNYINDTGCTAKELATQSDISASVISRYRTGERLPSADSDIVKKLADGLSKISGTDSSTIYNQMIDALTARTSLAKQAFYKIDGLVNSLGIKQADIARVFNYDASFISRVLSGQRCPSDIEGFIDDISEFITDYAISEDKTAVLLETIHASEESDPTRNQQILLLKEWLNQNDTPTISFLSKLDAFDVNSYFASDQYENISFPIASQIPTSRMYYGIDQMKKGELDFISATIMSRSMEDVYIYSDMSIQDMLKDNFAKLYNIGLSLMVKKGLRVHIIHYLNRPLDELFIGLQAWIPIYMTGLVSPYYFEDFNDNIFSHLTYYSGAAGLFGSALKGMREHGLYYLTRNKDELKQFHTRAIDMVSRATPLMDIYKAEDKPDFYDRMDKLLSESREVKNVLSTPPLATISNELLEKLVNNYISRPDYCGPSRESLLNEITTSANRERTLILRFAKNHKIVNNLNILSKEDFNKAPVYLSLGYNFINHSIPYTYETYLEHINLTRKFTEKTDNYYLEETCNFIYRNIQILFATPPDSKKTNPSWVLISKSISPNIQFLIHHPSLVKALSKMDV